MADTPEHIKARDEMLKRLNVIDRFYSIHTDLNSLDKGIVKKARDAKEKFTLEGLLTEGIVPPGVAPLQNEAQYAAASDDVKQHYLQGFELRREMGLSDSATILRRHGRKLFQNEEEKYIPALETIALEKSIMKHGDKKEEDFMRKYASYKGAENLLKDITDNKKIDPEAEEQLKRRISSALARKTHAFMAGKGYRDDACKIAANISALAAEQNPETLKLGAQEYLREAKEALDKAVGTETTIDQRVGKYVATAIENMAKDRDSKVQEAALHYTNKVYTGKTLGERPVKDFYS